ncbi:MAG TPA: putative glycolipid-binding domain-containing protein [Acidimicrobiales bacterium]
MTFVAPPPAAAWRHVDAREGFESVFFGRGPSGVRIEGRTCAIEDGHVWDVGYVIDADPEWRSMAARIRGRTVDGAVERVIESTGGGRWRVDGRAAPHLDGCLDIDLESSACTNTLPVHRLGLRRGDQAEAPAVYVRALDLAVERLDQTYRRIEDGTGQRYDYAAPIFGVACVLAYDGSGLIVDYPGIASRVG